MVPSMTAMLSATLDDDSTELRPLTRREYDAMVELGFFEGERVELLEGVLVRMASMGDRHAKAVKVLTRLFVRGLPDHYEVGPQTPVAATDLSEPEPDISVADVVPAGHGHPRTAYLAIEVCRTSHRVDLRIKPRIYAQAGIPSYWVFDLRADRVVVHTDPGEDGYATVSEVGPDAVLTFEGVEVPVADVLGLEG